MRAIRLFAATAAILVLLASCAHGGAESAPAGARRAALEARMQGFVRAMRNEDGAAFLDSFSSERPWRYVLRIDIADPGQEYSGREVTEVSPDSLRRDVRNKGDFHSYFLDPGNGGLGSVRMHVNQGDEWRLEGTRFTPGPEPAEDTALVWVTWRQERGRWVIDEIGEWYH